MLSDLLGPETVSRLFPLTSMTSVLLPCLEPLQHPNAVLTYQGCKLEGKDAIVQQLTSFGTVSCRVVQSIVVQSTSQEKTFLVFVKGTLCLGDDDPRSFSETFLIAEPQRDTYTVYNDIFALDD